MLDMPVRFAEIQKLLPPTGEEYSLAELSDACESLGLHCRGLQWAHGLPDFRPTSSTAVIPIVLANGRQHFVAILAAQKSRLLIGDTPGRPTWIEESELRDKWKWDGTALHLGTSPASVEKLVELTSVSNAVKWGLPVAIMLASSVLWPRPARAVRRRRVSVTKRRPVKAAGRVGFTAVELLVAIAVVGLLLSLILPAVQSARERSRNVQCLNNLRQVGMACLQFESAHRHLPSYRGKRKPGPNQGPVKTNLSVQAQLLPFLDQQKLFDRIDRNEDGQTLGGEPPGSEYNGDLLRIRVPVFVCPTDPLADNGISYLACAGTTPGVNTSTPESEPGAAKMGMFVRFNGARLSSVRDGLSNTAMFSERLVGDQDQARYTPSRDVADIADMPPGHWSLLLPEDVVRACRLVTSLDIRHSSYVGYTWLLGGYPQTLYNHVLPPNSAIPDCGYGYFGEGHGQGAISARSLHPGTVNVVMGDGAARPVNASIDLAVWRALASIRGEEVISEF